MTRIQVLAALFGIVVVGAGCGGGPTSTATDTTPATPTSAEGTYGSDPDLDQLYDRCRDGDSGACDDLYFDAPIGSEYEAFAEKHRGDADASSSGGGGGLDEGAIEDLALSITWENMTASDRSDICYGYNQLGAEISYEFFISETTDPISFAGFRRFFDLKC